MVAYAPNGKTALTGSGGRAVFDDKLVARVKTWSVNAVSSVTEWGDSESQGHTNRKAARKDATGSVVIAVDTATKIQSLFTNVGRFEFIGQNVKLALWQDVSDYWLFPCCIITGYSVSFSPDTKEVVEGNIDWGADGLFYHPGQGPFSDVDKESQTIPDDSVWPTVS